MAIGKHIPLEETGEARIDELEREVAEARETVLRRTAEMENMRRRHQQERTQLIFEANQKLIEELLPVIDDLERTLSHARPEDANSFVEGIQLVYKNFLKILERYGVQPIQSLGTKFNVDLHDALMEEARTDVEPGTVVTEVVKGYMMNDRVLRHAKVVIAKAEGE